MKTRIIPVIVIFVVSLTVVFSTVHAGQDNKSTVKALNGLGFSDFKGYEDWQDVAVSQTESGIKAILGNPAMMKAYREGIPGNGKPFPDGSKMSQEAWRARLSLDNSRYQALPAGFRSATENR